jgi:hypothetical protein
LPGYSKIVFELLFLVNQPVTLGENIRTYFIPIQRSILHPQPKNVCNNDTLMSALKELAADIE